MSDTMPTKLLPIQRAFTDALDAARRAIEAGKESIAVQQRHTRDRDTDYRLVAVDYPRDGCYHCFLFPGMLAQEWASNIVYALKDGALLQCTGDDIDLFFDEYAEAVCAQWNKGDFEIITRGG